jgi:hypothetical protein
MRNAALNLYFQVSESYDCTKALHIETRLLTDETEAKGDSKITNVRGLVRGARRADIIKSFLGCSCQPGTK